MRIQLLSDLHLEVQPQHRFTPAAGADLLVLAGDIGSCHAAAPWPMDDFGLGQFAPRSAGGAWPTPVLYVPGNHEYDGQDFDEARDRLRQLCDRLGIVWLDQAAVVLGGVRFVGTTLWSDFDALASTVPNGAGAGDARLKQRGKAFRAADHYLMKTATTRHGQPWLAAEMREEALQCQQWLVQTLQQPHAGKTVVVTHFAPSLRSADPRYGVTPGTAGFCNALDSMLDHADVWMHGHLHCPSDYVHSAPDGRVCRVVANPLGYEDKGEQQAFQPGYTVDLATSGNN